MIYLSKQHHYKYSNIFCVCTTVATNNSHTQAFEQNRGETLAAAKRHIILQSENSQWKRLLASIEEFSENTPKNHGNRDTTGGFNNSGYREKES